MRSIKNAVITGVSISFERFSTFWIHLDYGGESQAAGGIVLGNKKGCGIDLIKEICDVLEVEEWEKLKGKCIRVDSDFNKVFRLGHLLKDEWIDFEEFIKGVK